MYLIELQYIANLRKSTIDGHKHNSTMVSDASPGITTPKMNIFLFIWLMCLSAKLRTGWVLEMSPSDHYKWRYEVGKWLAFGWFVS